MQGVVRRNGCPKRNNGQRHFLSILSESVKCRFSKCRFSVLNLKFDFISDGGCTREKQIQKALGSLPPCGNRCRLSESAICSSPVHPPSEIKLNFKFKTLRWRPLRWRLTLSDSKVCRCFKSKTDSPETPFWTTVSPHDAFSAPLACSEGIALSLGNEALRSQEGKGFREEGDGGEGKKKKKRDAQKVL